MMHLPCDSANLMANTQLSTTVLSTQPALPTETLVMIAQMMTWSAQKTTTILDQESSDGQETIELLWQLLLHELTSTTQLAQLERAAQWIS